MIYCKIYFDNNFNLNAYYLTRYVCIRDFFLGGGVFQYKKIYKMLVALYVDRIFSHKKNKYFFVKILKVFVMYEFLLHVIQSNVVLCIYQCGYFVIKISYQLLKQLLNLSDTFKETFCLQRKKKLGLKITFREKNSFCLY